MSASVVEARGEGRCTPRIIFYCDGCTSESKVDFVFPQDGCGSALPELVPLFNGVKGRSIPACKDILRAGRDWKGIGNAWDDCCSFISIVCLGVAKEQA
eukprot:471428-Pelagomonas_calceolata.AAC.1